MRKWAERKAAAEGGAAVAASGESKKSKRAREEGPKADQRDDSAAKRAKTGAQDINAASGCSVFVQNLAPDVTDDALRAHFVQFGPVANCRVVRDKMGASKGFGYVDFSAADGAGSALAAQGEQLQLAGRCVELSRARPLKADDKDKHGPSSRTLFVSGESPPSAMRPLCCTEPLAPFSPASFCLYLRPSP
jgi:RNA recognition motif-containing protein